MANSKSVLDTIRVKTDDAFDRFTKAIDAGHHAETVVECQDFPPNHVFTALGSCPACGAPVYGPLSITKGEEAPPAVYSCQCKSNTPVPFSTTIHSK